MGLKSRKLALLTAAVMAAVPSLALALPQSLTIQGRVTAPDNTPITGSAVVFRVQVLTPDAARCILYDESQTLNLSATSGLFSINLNNGLGTVNAPATYSLERALSNRLSYSVSSTYCDSGTGTLSYAPGNTDNRKIRILFRDPATMTSFETIPELDLNPVAWAMEARTVGGFESANLLRIQDAGVPGAAPAFTTAQLNDLQSLIAGTSPNYMQSGTGSGAGAKLPTFSGNPSTLNPGAIWFDTTAGTVKYSPDGSTVQTVGTSSASGTITSITAGAGLTGGGTTGGVSLALTPSGVSGAGVAVGSASSVPVITYDTYGRITAATTAAISGTLPSGTNGQFLKSSGGSTWAGASILMGDLKNGAGTLPLFGTVNCSASQSMYWDSGADQIRCQNIALGNSQIFDVAWSKITGVPNLVANAGGTPSLLTDTEANLPTVHAAGRIFIASDTKKIFRDNGTSWDQLAASSGGTLTDVLSGAGISVTGTGATRTIALDNTGKASGTFYKVTTDADGRVSSGAGALVAADIPNLDWAKITTGKPNTIAGYAPDALKNEGGTPSFLTDTEANLPSTHTAGRIFIASDTKKIFRDTGSTWDLIASSAGSGGTLTDVTGSSGISVSGTGATRSVTLDNTGKVAGTFYKVTTDADGRVSSGAGALVAADIPNLDWSKITTGKPNFVLNGLDTTSFTSGPTSAKPTGQTAGRVFIDTTLQKIQYDNGSAWIDVASNGGTGFSGSLGGEVSGTQGATQVDSINGIGRSTISANLNAVTNATDAATASQLVKRDTNGDFAGRRITSNQLNLKDGSTNVVSLKANATSATYSLQLPAAAPAANQILQSDASGVLSWINPFSGAGISVSAPITNTSGTIGITAASGSTDGYITSTQFTSFTNKLANALNSANIFVGNASNVAAGVALSGNGTIDNTGKLTVTGIRDQAISGAGTAVGQVLRYSAANTWTPQFLTMKDLRSTVTGTQALTSSCTAGRTMYWDSATDSLGCQDIAISAATQVSGILPIANGGTGANTTSQGFVFAGPSSGAGAPAFRALTAADISGLNTYWSSVTGGIGYSAGNVGIGTTAPTAQLHIENSGADATWRVKRVSGSDLYINSSVAASIFGTAGATDLEIRTNNTARFNILSGGNIGIGTSAPIWPFQVDRTSTANGGGWSAFFREPSAAGVLIGSRGASTAAAVGTIMGTDAANSTFGPLALNPFGGNIGIGTLAPSVALDIGSRTDAIRVPNGTAAQQPGQASMPTAANGMIRYNTSTNALEAYVNGAWTNLATVGGTQSFAGNVSVGGTFTSTGAATFNGGATVAGGALAMSSQNITGVGSNITAAASLAISATGAANGITLNSGTSGAVNAGSANGTSLSVLSPAASSVNYITIKGAPAGASPTIGSGGSDTNVNITLAPKGTGNTIINNGSLAIGTPSPVAPLHISSASTAANSAEEYGLYTAKTFSIADANLKQGIRTTVTANHTSGSLAHLVGMLGLTVNSSSATVTNQYGYYARNDSNSGAITTNAFGLFVSDASGSGTINNQYGLYVSALGRGGSNYSVYTAGTTPSYFGGYVGIGSASPIAALDVRGQLNLQDGNGGGYIYWPASGAVPNFSVRSGTPSSYVDRFTIIPSGNVGIGTTSPGTNLDVQSTGNAVIRAQSTGTGSLAQMNLTNPSRTFSLTNNAADNLLSFYYNSNNRLQFDLNNQWFNSGNVGIGTTNPGRVLHVVHPTAATILLQNTGVTSGNQTATMYTDGNDGSLKFGRFNDTGSSLTRTDLTILATNGNVGVGVASPGAKLEVNGDARINNIVGGQNNGAGNFHIDAWSSGTTRGVYLNWFGGTGGAFVGNGASALGPITASSFNTSSDRTLKKNIAPIPDALERLNKMSGVRFDWIDPKQGTERQVGVIAQEVQKVYPELVMTNKSNNKLSVNYAGLVAPVLQAVKELYAKFLDDHAELAKLKTQNEEMSRELASLKALVCVDHPHAPECVKFKKK